jgi:hypothetical protein
MRPGVHRFEVPTGRHRRPRPIFWMPWWIPTLLVFAGLSGMAAAVVHVGGVPSRLYVPPAVHATPGVQYTGPVLSDPPLGGQDGQGDGQQDGQQPASRSTDRPVPPVLPTQAPAAGDVPQVTPTSLSLPVVTPTPTKASPTPSPTCDQHPGKGKGRSTKPQPQPQVQVEVSAALLTGSNKEQR